MHRISNKLAVLAAATIAPLALAGDVNPPAGPIESTFKDLDDIQPRFPLTAETAPGDANSVFEINTPGYYYLTSDLVVPAGFNGIEVEARRVIIDLNGYQLIGNDVAAHGIAISQARDNYIIKNGVIIGFTGDGVAAGNDFDVTVMNIQTINNGGRGIAIGPRGRIINCVARDNAGNGMTFQDNSTVIDSIAVFNQQDGFFSERESSTLVRCKAISNVGDGLEGATKFTVRDSVFFGNGGIGVNLDGVAVLESVNASFNGGDGVFVENGNTVIRSSTMSNNGQTLASGDGAQLFGKNNVITNSAANNNNRSGFVIFENSSARGSIATGNGRSGFEGAFGVSLFDCRGESNGVHGAEITVRGTVEGGAYTFNAFDGVRIPTGIVRDIYAAKNGQTGIWLASPPTADIRSGVRCEGNTVAQNNFNGIRVMSNGHFVARNFLKGNAGNEIEGLLTSSWVAQIMVGPGTASTSNSFANFELLN